MEVWEALSPFLVEEEPFLCQVALGRPSLCWRVVDLPIIPLAFEDAPVMPGPGKLGFSWLATAGSLGASLRGCGIPWAQPHQQPPCVGVVLSPQIPTRMGPVGVQPHFGVRSKHEAGGCWERS